MTLNWSTDPKLLDEQPTPPNHWETANPLIERKGLASVLQEDFSFSNLYGIMIRKIDFVREKKSDRILARFPFLVMNNAMIEAIQAKELLLAEATREYFYRSVNKSIFQWRERIRAFLDRGVMPFPIYRCAEELATGELPSLPVMTNPIPFASARGEKFTFPAKLTEKLAYLCGISNGDGNLRDYWIIVVDETKKHIEFITELLEKLFNKQGKIMKLGGAWLVKLNLLWAVRLFNFLTDQTINEPKYDSLREPLVFRQLGEPFRALYWRGAFDADGCYKNRLSFSSTSERYSRDFQAFLKEIRIASKLSPVNGDAFKIEIPAIHKRIYAEKVGALHPKKMLDFIDFLSSNYQRRVFKGINKKNLTEASLFFDFCLLPNLQVLGLDEYFETEIFVKNPDELHWYRKGKGISIRRLERILKRLGIEKPIMVLLNGNKEKVLFRSANSKPIKLDLRPSKELIEIMGKVAPTARGISIFEEFNSDLLKKEIEERFAIKVVNENKVRNKLLSKYFQLFGIYEFIDTGLNTEYIMSLKDNWMQSLSK